MSAPVTDEHRELARQVHMPTLLWAVTSDDIRKSLVENLAQAIADAEARGYERGVRAAAKRASRRSLDERFGNDILALLTPNKVKP